MNDKNNYRGQSFDKCCGKCKHIEGHGYPYEASCNIINPTNHEVLMCDDPFLVEWYGICDKYEPRDNT